MAEPQLVMHQLFSPAFPTGGFAYSHGLETLVAAGSLTSAEALWDWLDSWARHGAGWSDAVLFARAAAGDPPAPLDVLALALAGSAGRRRETRLQGAAFAATCRAVWRLDLPDMAYPVAAGRAVHLMQIEPGAALETCLFNTCSSYVSAAMRLVPLGQSDGQQVLSRAAPLCAEIAANAAETGTEEIGGFAPAIDIAAMRHETLPTKLFRS